MDLSTITLTGNLTSDPDLRYTPGGKAVCNFDVACNHTKDRVSFFKCVAWEKTAEAVTEYLRKGSKIVLDGTLQNRVWEKDGEKRTTSEIHARSVIFLDKPEGRKEEPSNQSEPEFDDSDIPF